MSLKVNKLIPILSVLITLYTATLLLPSSTKAEILFQDDFNDNHVNNWLIKNFNHARFGSYSDYGQLNISENNQELQIIGEDYIPDIYYPEYNWYYGWFGKSLISSNSFSLNNPISFHAKFRIVNADIGYVGFLTIEFNQINRIVLSIGNYKYDGQLYWPIATQLLLEENEKVRCVGDSLENENQTGCISNNIDLQLNKTYNLEILLDPSTKHIFGLVDGNIVHAGTFKGELSNFQIGIAASVRDTGNYIDARFDNLELYEISSNPSLNVPDLKQFATPWGPQEYDTASNWFPSNPTIKRWGCAMTSAAMTLRYYNHDTNPENLNNWLKNNNGYNREGGGVWPAIGAFSKKNAQKIDSELPLKQIEWKRYKLHDNSIIDNQIDLQQPVILNVPGHFIVAKGKAQNDYYINDPASSVFALLSQTENFHGGGDWKIETFKPSNTDLSYIYLLLNPNIQMEVFDTNGNKIEDGYSIEEPIISDEEPFEQLGQPLNSFALAKPESGFYRIKLTGNSADYQLDSYLYDLNGDSELKSFTGLLIDNDENHFLINFNSN